MMDEVGLQYVRTQRTVFYISQFSNYLHPQLHCKPIWQPHMDEQLPASSPCSQIQPRWTQVLKILLKSSLPQYKIV